jgi:predicted nucleic acid-binding protein
MSAVVSDTTSLIALAGQGRLDLLGACFEEVLLPDAVYAEWLAGDPEVVQIVRDLTALLTRSILASLRDALVYRFLKARRYEHETAYPAPGGGMP